MNPDMNAPNKGYDGSAPPPYPEYNQYPPGQPYAGYPPQVVQQPQVVYQTIVQNPIHGGIPVNTVCQFCQAQIITGIQYENGLLTWLLCGGLALLGCWLGCCLIPFCVDDCKDVIHICPNCNKKVGEHKRL